MPKYRFSIDEKVRFTKDARNHVADPLDRGWHTVTNVTDHTGARGILDHPQQVEIDGGRNINGVWLEPQYAFASTVWIWTKSFLLKVRLPLKQVGPAAIRTRNSA
jgi:hypothetical protein